MRPFLKWAGGKTRLLPEILSRLPQKINVYYEPFLGGGAVFFALEEARRFKYALLGDTNGELVSTYSALASYPSAIIARLRVHAAAHSNAYYYYMRSSTHRSVVGRAARMIYLNRTCFNGLYRVNKKGEFNVPVGRYANPTICDEGGLWEASQALKDAVLHECDFEGLAGVAQAGDAVYFDPPYVPLSPTSSFTAYGKEGFGKADHERLRDCARKLGERGVFVLLSNSDTPLVRELYRDFRVEEVQAPRRINSKGGRRGDVAELLITWEK